MSKQNQPEACVQESGDHLCLGNEWIELGFSRAKNGAWVSLLDKQTGCPLRRDAEAPTALFRLALRRESDRELEWIESSQATRF